MRNCATCEVVVDAGYVLDNGMMIIYYCDNHRPPHYDDWYNTGHAYWTSWHDKEEAE